MRQIRLLFLLLLLVIFSLNISKAQQDSIQYQKQIFKVQSQSNLVLSGWSILNLTISPLSSKSLFNPVTVSDHFHSSNFNWNTLNIGIVGLGYYSTYRSSHKNWTMSELSIRKKRIERTLAINTALDFLYIAAGVFLKYATNPNDVVNYPLYQGNGNSLILQGSFLLIFDSVFLRKFKNIKLSSME